MKLASNGRYKISVKSEEDVGSCFSFQMEFGKADGPVEEEKEILGNAEGVKVLLVEDNPVNLALEKRILARQGFLVDAVDTPTMVEEMVRRKSYDLILLDIGMPGLNGYELARRLRKLPGGGRLLIVALTAYRKQDMEGHEGSEYFDGCLSKPVDPDLLRTKLAGYLSVKEEERKEDGEGAPYVDFARLNELLDYDKDALEELLAIFLEDKKDTKRELLSCISKKKPGGSTAPSIP